MTPQNPELNERARQAAKLIAKPADYKVCEQCDSIVSRKATFCPNCSGYRFDDDSAVVVAQAQKLAGRDQTSVTRADLI